MTIELDRGITRWPVEGTYTREQHAALYCTVTRSQVSLLKNVVAAVDDDAFMIIGQGHEAIGKGFKPHSWRPPVVEHVDKVEEADGARW